MPNYTKLFNSIITSTIWSEDDKTRIVWITMLAIADQNGEVQGSIPGLARIAGVSLQDTEAAINKFLSPDPYSRTPEFDGRRICKIDGGWELLNHAKYRRMASLADKKDADAKRQKRVRDRASCVTQERDSHASVTQKTYIAEAYTEAEANTEELIRANPKRFASFEQVNSFAKSQPMGISDECIEAFFDKMEEIGWVAENGLPLADWKARFRRFATNWQKNLSAPNKFSK